MEKYSSFRDPGTGIQPFSTPLAPVASNVLEKFTLPFRYLLGVVRTSLILVLALVYIVLVWGLCMILVPIPPLHRAMTWIFTSIIARMILLLVGLFWIPVEQITLKRGKQPKDNATWAPQAGDIIVSNSVSWVEILWLAFRFDPIFVLPISDSYRLSSPSPIPLPASKPGRRTTVEPSSLMHPPNPRLDRTPIVGFVQVSLFGIMSNSGHVPPSKFSHPPKSLEDILKSAKKPLVVFPECTTSNGKGLLRFANIFGGAKLPLKNFDVYLMCVRCDPPTAFSPSLTHSIPSSFLNPLPHIFSLATSPQALTVSIRLLSPSEMPDPSLSVAGDAKEDQISEALSMSIANMGKMKRTALGWESKAAFLELHKSKRDYSGHPS